MVVLFRTRGQYFCGMRTWWKRGGLILLAWGACSDPDNTPETGITVVAGGGLTDTVATTFAQALVVEVTTPEPVAEGVVVRFESTSAPGTPTVLVAPIVGMSPFSPVTTIATDSRGRASVRLQFGTVAGPAELHVTVPELGYSATVPYTVEPGTGVSITASPQDTVVPVGSSFTSRSSVVDQFGNPLNETVALADPTANLAVNGSQITASGPGRGTVTLRAGGLSDVLRVFVGPQGEISGLTETQLIRFAINGNVASETSLGHAGGPISADWSVNGELLVADDQGGGPLRVIQPNGQVFTLPTVGEAWPLYPEFSPDGQWIYYSRSDLGLAYPSRPPGRKRRPARARDPFEPRRSVPLARWDADGGGESRPGPGRGLRIRDRGAARDRRGRAFSSLLA